MLLPAQAIIARDDLELRSAILVTVPVPEESAIESAEFETLLGQSLRAAAKRGVKGKEVTPFLLAEISSLSKGKTLTANIALLENNARVAAQIAVAI